MDDLISKVRKTFARYGVPVDDKNVCLHQGLFEETWPSAPVEDVAFAHIDCDWYDPVRYCLEQAADKMVPGAIFLIDDYNDYGGAKTAVDEFLEKRHDFRLENGANPYLIKR